MKDPDWQADLRRYPPHPWFREPSIWAVWLYRYGRRNDRRRPGPVRWILNGTYRFLYRPIELLTGITLPKSVRVGPGLLIWHFGNVLVHEDAVIGANCTLRHGVTIGIRHEGGPVPTLEDDVELGAAAMVLGGVRVGRGAKIGAMTLVLDDVPPGATAVGVPARIIERGSGTAGHEAAVTREGAVEMASDV
jgi:serine O-acetyltransferase